ncbi:MAG: ATP-binding protein [Pseudomonadota bacterium]
MKTLSISIQTEANELVIRPSVEFVRKLLEQFSPFAENERLLYSAELIFNEALVNIVEHTYQSANSGSVRIIVEIGAEMLKFRFEDWGKGFDPESVPAPDLETPPEGGMGLWFIREFVDELHYRSEPDGKNVLELTKRIPGLHVNLD